MEINSIAIFMQIYDRNNNGLEIPNIKVFDVNLGVDSGYFNNEFIEKAIFIIAITKDYANEVQALLITMKPSYTFNHSIEFGIELTVNGIKNTSKRGQVIQKLIVFY